MNTNTTTTRRTLTRRALSSVVGVVAAAGLVLAAAPAQADSYIAGVRFHTTVECGGSTMVFSTNTVMDSGSLAKLFVWDAPTQRWVTDGVWQRADAWASFHAAGINFRPGYYTVYMQYAQSTTSGWKYSGETMTTYVQRSGYGRTSSRSCYMG